MINEMIHEMINDIIKEMKEEKVQEAERRKVTAIWGVEEERAEPISSGHKWTIIQRNPIRDESP